jgi:hypothetical protein
VSLPPHAADALKCAHKWIRTSRQQTLSIVPSTFELTDPLETRQQLLFCSSATCCPAISTYLLLASCVRLNSTLGRFRT